MAGWHSPPPADHDSHALGITSFLSQYTQHCVYYSSGAGYAHRTYHANNSVKMGDSQPRTGLASSSIEVGCQSFMLFSSVNYNWNKGYNSTTLRFI